MLGILASFPRITGPNYAIRFLVAVPHSPRGVRYSRGIFALILGLETDQIGPEVVYAIAYIWVLITLGVRRLHDIDRKGIWLLFGLVPAANFVLRYWLLQSARRKQGSDSFNKGCVLLSVAKKCMTLNHASSIL